MGSKHIGAINKNCNVYGDLINITGVNSTLSSLAYDAKVEICFNLIQPVTTFTGRHSQLSELEKVLLCGGQEDISKSPAVVIIGLGGTGKTELARKYAFDQGKFYKHIVWIDAETFESMKSAFKQLAAHYLGVFHGEQNFDVNVAIYKVYERLSKSRSLFIFDNAEGYGMIKTFLPLLKQNMGNVHILLTSRRRDWDAADEGNISEIHLVEFEQEEAENFIKISLNDKMVEIIDVRRLANKLARFPLALKQATAYINEKDHKSKYVAKKFDINDFIDELRCQAKKLLDHNGYSGYNRYTMTVFATLSVTLDNLITEEWGKHALEMLNIIAYLAPDDIEIGMFEAAEDAVALLEKYAILTIHSGGKASVHRLVQQIARLKTDELEYVRKGLNVVNNNRLEMNHAMHVWSFAVAHYDLIKEFYFSPKSSYGIRHYSPLHLFTLYGNYGATEVLLEIVGNDWTMKSQILRCVDISIHIPLRAAVINGLHHLYRRETGRILHDRFDFNYETFSCHNWDLITLLINKGKDVNTVDDYADFLLIECAICDGKANIVKFLIEKGADVNAITFTNTKNELYKAIEENDLDKLKIVVALSADINALHDNGMTLLHLAVYANNFEIVKLLIEAGANVNTIHHRGRNALHYAISANNFDAATFLLQNGAQINTTHHRNETLLHYAIFRGYSEIAKLLIENGADVNAIYERGETLLQYAFAEDKTDIAKLLIEYGADSTPCTENGNAIYHGRTPLYYAFLTLNTEIVDLLIQNGADVLAVYEELNLNLMNRNSGFISYVLRIFKLCCCCKRNANVSDRSVSLTSDEKIAEIATATSENLAQALIAASLRYSN